MYSIFGLNDFINICLKETISIKDPQIENYKIKANRIYSSSRHSLKSLINMFDTGSRTLYDLKHIINPLVNPNVARWDYHSVHVSQLFYMVKIIDQQENVSEILLNAVAKRWLGYCRGLWNKNSQIQT